MPINHINLCATNVAALTDTLSNHLGFKVLESGKVPDMPQLPNPGKDYAFLIDGNGFYIVISQIDESAGPAYPTGFHFATMLATRDDVRAKHEELRDSGYDPGKISDFEAMGAKWSAFYFDAGDGLKIEVNTCSRDITALKSNR